MHQQASAVRKTRQTQECVGFADGARLTEVTAFTGSFSASAPGRSRCARLKLMENMHIFF